MPTRLSQSANRIGHSESKRRKRAKRHYKAEQTKAESCGEHCQAGCGGPVFCDIFIA